MNHDELARLCIGAHIILSRGGSVVVTGIDNKLDKVYCENLYGENVCFDKGTLRSSARVAKPRPLISIIDSDQHVER